MSNLYQQPSPAWGPFLFNSTNLPFLNVYISTAFYTQQHSSLVFAVVFCFFINELLHKYSLASFVLFLLLVCVWERGKHVNDSFLSLGVPGSGEPGHLAKKEAMKVILCTLQFGLALSTAEFLNNPNHSCPSYLSRYISPSRFV